MRCQDCEGLGFVLGEASGSRLKCLRCNGTGITSGPQVDAASRPTVFPERPSYADDFASDGDLSDFGVTLKSG